jgi:hypothetical protein
VVVVAGGILVVAGKRSRDHVTSLGVSVAAAGLAVGLVALLVYSSTRGRRSARRRPAGHRHRATSAGPGRERKRVLDPTSVYSPGGLIDVPRDARAPGSPGAARAAGVSEPPGTMRPSGSQGAREARTGPPPRPGYQAGMQAATGAAPGWRPPGPAGRPPHQSMPPLGWVGPGEAFPPHEASPYRQSPAARQAFPSREGPPPRPGLPPRPGPPPRYGDTAAPPRDPWRPDGPVPPSFEPGHPSRGTRPGPFGPVPGRGTGRPSAGPGYGPSAGRRPAPPGAPGQRVPAGPGPASAGPRGFLGGYAQVIRPSDHSGPSANRVQPSSGRPASQPADHDVYVYRDVSDPAPTSSGRHAAADDTAYWYDLLAEDHVPQREETRGPFEPLLPSSATPGTAEPVGTVPAPGRPETARDESPEAPDRARARKLEQLRELYLTAEAIGEQNVDKHFDQLLAQQRQLISEYFKQPAADKPAVGLAAEVDMEHPVRNDPGATGRHAGPPEGASVRAEPPRAW